MLWRIRADTQRPRIGIMFSSAQSVAQAFPEGLHTVTNVSVTNVFPQPLGAEMGAQDRGGFVVGLEPLALKSRQRIEAVDRAGIVDVGRLHASVDRAIGIGAAFVAQRVVAAEVGSRMAARFFLQATCLWPAAMELRAAVGL